MFLAFVKAERSDSTPCRFGGVGCPEIYMTFANPPPKLILAVSRFACSRLTARSFFLSPSLFRGIKPRRFHYDRRFIFTYKFCPLESSKLKPEREGKWKKKDTFLVKSFHLRGIGAFLRRGRSISLKSSISSFRQRSKSRSLSPAEEVDRIA